MDITPTSHRRLLEESQDALRAFREDIYRNKQLATGTQWSLEDKAFLESSDRYTPIWDIISPQVEAWIGTELSNRRSVRVVGRESEDRRKAEVFNNVLDHDNKIVEAALKEKTTNELIIKTADYFDRHSLMACPGEGEEVRQSLPRLPLKLPRLPLRQ